MIEPLLANMDKQVKELRATGAVRRAERAGAHGRKPTASTVTKLRGKRIASTLPK
jgi:hypothetical protein